MKEVYSLKEISGAIQEQIKPREARIKQNQAENKILENDIKEFKKLLTMIGKIKEVRKKVTLIGEKIGAVRRKRTGPSIPDLVEKTLKEAGKPLHVKEISEKIGVGTARVSASLQHFLKEGKRFERTARATFSLTGAIKKETRPPRKAPKPEEKSE